MPKKEIKNGTYPDSSPSALIKRHKNWFPHLLNKDELLKNKINNLKKRTERDAILPVGRQMTFYFYLNITLPFRRANERPWGAEEYIGTLPRHTDTVRTRVRT